MSVVVALLAEDDAVYLVLILGGTLLIAAMLWRVLIAAIRSRVRSPRYPRPRRGEVLPAWQMKEKYGLTIERHRPPKLDISRVPVHLRDLFLLASKWGIEDDVIRNDLHAKASDDEKREFKRAFDPHSREVNDWLNTHSLESPMTREMAAFMYMALGYEEMGLYNPEWEEPDADNKS